MWKFIAPLFLIIVSSFLHVFEPQEKFFYDQILQLRPQQKVSSDIAIIEIDDQTLNQLGQWPLPRDFHASLLDVLKELGAKTIVFDLVFSEASEHDPVFSKSIKNAQNVLLPQVYYLSEHLSADHMIKLNNPSLAAITKSLKEGVAGIGHINVLLDPDGKFRKVPLFVKHDDALVPELGFLAACQQLGMNCKNISITDDQAILDGRISIPVENSNSLLVNYPGKWKSSFKHFSYLEILTSYQNWKTNQGGLGRLADLKGAVCFIGLTAVGTVDLKASPLESQYPMLGLDASVCNSVLERSFLRKASWVINALLALLAYLLCVFICTRCKPWMSLLCCLGIAALGLIFADVSLDCFGTWVDIFLFLVVILLVYVFCVAVRWARERNQLEALEKEMIIGQKIQKQFLKGPKQEIHSIDLALDFQPARYVAGDFYDIFKMDDQKTGIMIADVSGKGLPAALCMAQSISLFRIFSRQISSPEETLKRLNQELCLMNSERFVTALYGVVDAASETICLASAGQGPMYIYRDEARRIEELAVSAHPPLGVMEDTVYQAKVYKIHKKDKLFMFSDGIYEARNAEDKELGLENIKEILLANIQYSNKKIVVNTISKINEYSGKDSQFDDMTLIIFSLT